MKPKTKTKPERKYSGNIIIITGDPVGGFLHLGPFNSKAEAGDYMDRFDRALRRRPKSLWWAVMHGKQLPSKWRDGPPL